MRRSPLSALSVKGALAGQSFESTPVEALMPAVPGAIWHCDGRFLKKPRICFAIGLACGVPRIEVPTL